MYLKREGNGGIPHGEPLSVHGADGDPEQVGVVARQLRDVGGHLAAVVGLALVVQLADGRGEVLELGNHELGLERPREQVDVLPDNPGNEDDLSYSLTYVLRCRAMKKKSKF